MDYSPDGPISGDVALARLMEGNRRYVDEKGLHPNQSQDCRRRVTSAQRPFAVILGCSDSRVPPEIIFDQGLGDLFVVRVAGNVVGTMVLGSIEYAAAHLGTPLIMVLGHSGCGAVGATAEGGALEGCLESVAAAIRPALDSVENPAENVVDDASKANAKRVAEQLKNADPILQGLFETGKLDIVPAFYDLQTGMVEVIS